MKEAIFALFVLCALIAEILGTLGGFGSSVIFVPLANFFMDFQSVLGITAIFHVFSNISKLWLFKKYLNIKIILLIGIPSLLFVLAGAYLSASWNAGLLQFILGVFLCIFAVFFLVFPNFKIPPKNPLLIALGSIAGFLAGLIGTGGAIRGVALASMGMGKEIFVGTSAAIDLMVDLSRGVIYAEYGFVHLHDIFYIIALFFVAIIGSFIGKKLLEKINQNQFQKIVLVFVFISGGMLIFKHWP